MRRPPPLSDLPRFPITGGLALLAAGVTIAHFAGGVELTPIYATEQVQRGQVWRFVTSVLPHGNAFHLLFNLWGLWTFGTFIEQVLGYARTIALYVFLGLGSMAAQYALDTGAIGLSGILYGLWGLCYMLSRRDPRFHDATDSRLNTTLTVWFFLCIVLTYTGVMPVGNVAHGSGAVIGGLVGLAMAARPRMVWWAAAVLLVGSSVGAAVLFRPWINFSRNAEDEFRLGYDAVEKGAVAEGEQWYRRAVRIEPKNHRAWFNLSLLCLRDGRTAEAAQYLQRAAELDPGQQKYKQASRELEEVFGAEPATRPTRDRD